MKVSRDQWIKEIKLMLGGSRILSLEIDDDEISSLIDMASRKMFPYITDTDIITRPYARVISLKNENVGEVLKVLPATEIVSSSIASGSGMVSDELLFDFQSYKYVKFDGTSLMRGAVSPDVYIPFEYVAQDKRLFISEGYTTGNVSIVVSREVIELEDIRDERALTWIFDYSLALAKEVIGRIRSKARSSNVPIELDGDTLLSEANSDKDRLESELRDEQYGPTIILR